MGMGMTKLRIMVADDEEKYHRVLKMHLGKLGHTLILANNGEEAVDLVADDEPDVVLLDVMMPIMNGIEACLRIREFSSVPIIIVTALADEANTVKGLLAGADDYITKPFGADELVARIYALLRRTRLAGDKQLRNNKLYETRHFIIDIEQQSVIDKKTKNTIELTPNEYKLLEYFADNPRRVLLQTQLLHNVWDYEGDNTDLVRKTIWRLRQKIEPDPKRPTYIHTRQSVGYIFDPPD